MALACIVFTTLRNCWNPLCGSLSARYRLSGKGIAVSMYGQNWRYAARLYSDGLRSTNQSQLSREEKAIQDIHE